LVKKKNVVGRLRLDWSDAPGPQTAGSFPGPSQTAATAPGVPGAGSWSRRNRADRERPAVSVRARIAIAPWISRAPPKPRFRTPCLKVASPAAVVFVGSRRKIIFASHPSSSGLRARGPPRAALDLVRGRRSRWRVRGDHVRPLALGESRDLRRGGRAFGPGRRSTPPARFVLIFTARLGRGPAAESWRAPLGGCASQCPRRAATRRAGRAAPARCGVAARAPRRTKATPTAHRRHCGKRCRTSRRTNRRLRRIFM